MLEIQNLKKTYKNTSSTHDALRDINVKFGNNGLVFLFGSSGAGKSTLMNIMAGLDTYDSGEVIYNGTDIKSMSQSKRDIYRSKEIAIIFEKNNLIDRLTVEENIKVAVELSGLKVEMSEINNALKTVKLDGFQKRKINELSSGELQRVEIAKILVVKPKIIFADEPTANLDAENSKIFWEALKEYSKKALVVCVAHSKEIVEKFADRVIQIKAGQIVSDSYYSKTLDKKDAALFTSTKRKKEEEKINNRSNLSFKSSARIGLKFLNKSKLKLVSMFVLISLTLMMFAISYLVSIFDSSYALAKATINQGQKYIVFENQTKDEISKDTQQNIFSNSVDNELYKLYSTEMYLKFLNREQTKITGIMEVFQEENSDTNKIGQKVLYGKYPTSLDTKTKIAISDYLAKQMLINGTKYFEGSEENYLDISKRMQDVIGKTIEISDNKYEVSAIYETNYSTFTNQDLMVKKGCEEDFNYYNQTTYSVIHTAPSKSIEIIKNVQETKNIQFSFIKNSMSSLNLLNVYSQTKAQESSILLNSYKQTLTANEVLLPVEVFNKIYNSNITYNETQENFSSVIAGKGTKITLKTNYGYSDSFTIVGLTKGNEIVFADNLDNNLIGRIGEIVQHTSYPVLKLVAPVKHDLTSSKQIRILLDNGLEYTGRYGEELVNVTNSIDGLKIAFVVSTVFLSLFSVYLMFTFFLDVARHNRKSIGSLRAMGANFVNLIGIFATSCLILAVASIVTGLILGVIGSMVINLVISSAFSLPLSILNINFGMFGYTIILGILITILGSLVPILTYCRKTPVEVIKK